MGKNLLKEIGIGFILVGAIGNSGCGTIYPGMYLNDKGLGIYISRDLNEKREKLYEHRKAVYDPNFSMELKDGR